MNHREVVLILDFGSQNTQLIARRIREARVYCEIHPCTTSFEAMAAPWTPKAIVLSGGPASVYGDGAPTLDPRVFELGVPVLGICYGMQLIAHLLGGKVAHARRASTARRSSQSRKPRASSHGFAPRENLERLDVPRRPHRRPSPPGFETIGISATTPLLRRRALEKRIYGVQFHPEVVHTPRGGDMLAAVPLRRRGSDAATWTAGVFAEEAIAAVRAQVGDRRARHLRPLRAASTRRSRPSSATAPSATA